MNNIHIKASCETLQVDCDAENGVINLSGISYPQDAAEFFEPISEWLENYINKIAGTIVLNVNVSYLNSSSTKFMCELMEKMEAYYISGGKASINWYYVEDDVDIKEAGQEFKEDLTLPFAVKGL